MRRLTARIEALAPSPFILLVGLAGGVLQGVPPFFLGTAGSAAPNFARTVAAVGLSMLWWAAALLVLWAAVRRRRFGIWMTAWHLTLGLVLADVLALALGYVVASIETHGEYVDALVHAPLSASTGGLIFVLIRSPIWFIGSAILVAIGRRLSGGSDPDVVQSSTATFP